MTSEKENEHFPWDIGDLTDDEQTSEDEIFSKTKKYVKFILILNLS